MIRRRLWNLRFEVNRNTDPASRALLWLLRHLPEPEHA